jgi:hypothetical protein
VPEEFADAYRQAYERALAEQAGQRSSVGAHRADASDDEVRDDELADAPQEEREDTAPLGAHAAWPEQEVADPGPEEGLGVGGLLGEPVEEPGSEPGPESVPAPGGAPEEAWTEYTVQSGLAQFRESRWFVPALLVLAVLVLVLGAYGVGRIFATGVNDTAPVAGQTDQATVPASDPSEQQATSTRHQQQHQQQHRQQHRQHRQKSTHAHPAVWKGAVTSTAIGSASAGCTAPSGVDAAGHKVTYQPANAVDGRADTAWRCPGKAIGRTLTIHLPRAVPVGEVGLVPGYAKTDPASGADRYAENNRITRVRWSLGKGRSVVQRLDGSAQDRSMRTIRVPRTTTDTITLQVLGVREGPRDTTCVSEVRVGRAG